MFRPFCRVQAKGCEHHTCITHLPVDSHVALRPSALLNHVSLRAFASSEWLSACHLRPRAAGPGVAVLKTGLGLKTAFVSASDWTDSGSKNQTNERYLPEKRWCCSALVICSVLFGVFLWHIQCSCLVLLLNPKCFGLMSPYSPVSIMSLCRPTTTLAWPPDQDVDIAQCF